MTLKGFDTTKLQTMQLELLDKVAHIRLCRPAQLNTMIPQFWLELPQLVNAIDDESAARAIVISSTGKHFSAGMDLSVFQQLARGQGELARDGERFRRAVLDLQNSFNVLENVRIPVLCAVQGGAIGGALDMLCACDMRYCTQDAFFTIKETELGMTADVGTLQRLPHLIPQGLARELAFTGRNLLAQEALQAGFVNQVFDDHAQMLEQVLKIAQQIAVHSPMAVMGCKQMLNYARNHSLADSLEYMATWQAGMFQMTDIQTAMTAQQQKQTPEYADLHAKAHVMRSQTD